MNKIAGQILLNAFFVTIAVAFAVWGQITGFDTDLIYDWVYAHQEQVKRILFLLCSVSTILVVAYWDDRRLKKVRKNHFSTTDPLD